MTETGTIRNLVQATLTFPAITTQQLKFACKSCRRNCYALAVRLLMKEKENCVYCSLKIANKFQLSAMSFCSTCILEMPLYSKSWATYSKLIPGTLGETGSQYFCETVFFFFGQWNWRWVTPPEWVSGSRLPGTLEFIWAGHLPTDLSRFPGRREPSRPHCSKTWRSSPSFGEHPQKNYKKSIIIYKSRLLSC